nr:MAG TPA: Protein of unknown function (DUF2633) [Caudoviricetes sp.]
MYERIKTYISRYYWVYYICAAVFIVLFGRFIFGGSNDSDHQRTVEHLERAKGQQRESLDINKDVKTSVERSTQLNRQASERIVKAQEYQRRASDRIKESASRLDEAERLLERNAELIERVEQGYQEEQGDRRATTQTAEHVGSN